MLASFQAWLAQPFNSNMSATKWLAFAGLLIAISIFWRIVLSHLDEI